MDCRAAEPSLDFWTTCSGGGRHAPRRTGGGVRRRDKSRAFPFVPPRNVVATGTLVRSALVTTCRSCAIRDASAVIPDALATIRVATSARIAARNASMDASVSRTTEVWSPANSDPDPAPAPNTAASLTSAKKSKEDGSEVSSSEVSTAAATRGRAVPFGATLIVKK
tara:strand:- start:946 stop:1446 length:501 start_codon:yes stop_codon:yes gene_type:complete